MNIIVCIKQVVDTEGHIRVDRKSGSVYSPNMVISHLDELAIEEAVRIKKQLVDTKIRVLCMSDTSAEKVMRSALRMGADEAVNICDTSLSGSDSLVTGHVLAKAIGLEAFDLILCGQKAADTRTGLTGAVIAEVLHIPLVTSVIGISIQSSTNKLRVQRKIGGAAREVLETSIPAVLTIAASSNKTSYPSLRAIKNAEKKHIEMLDLHALNMSPALVGASGSLITATRVSPARPSLQYLFIPDNNLPAIDRINQLMSGGIVDRKTKMIFGEPQEIASTFIKFVKNLNIL